MSGNAVLVPCLVSVRIHMIKTFEWKKRIDLGQQLRRIQSILTRKVWWQKDSMSIIRRQRTMDGMKRCYHPQIRQVFLPQLTQYQQVLIDMHRNLVFGDSKSIRWTKSTINNGKFKKKTRKKKEKYDQLIVLSR